MSDVVTGSAKLFKRIEELEAENQQLRLDAHTNDAFYGDRIEELEAENQQLRELLGEFTRWWQPLNKLPNQQQKVWMTDGVSVWSDWTNRLDFDESDSILWMPFITPPAPSGVN